VVKFYFNKGGCEEGRENCSQLKRIFEQLTAVYAKGLLRGV